MTDNQTASLKLGKTEAEKSSKSWSEQPLFKGQGVVIEGDVRFGKEVSVWSNAVIRTESEPVEIGDGSNVQDLCVIHTDPGFPVKIGKNVTLGHGAIVHGAELADDVLIGMGAIVMNGAKIGKGALIAAGALISEGKEIEPGALMAGVPAKKIRTLSLEEQQANAANARHYVEEARKRIAKETDGKK